MSQHIAEWIDAYMDGELSSEQQRRVESHLMECAECREQVEQRQKLSLLLQSAPPAADLKPENRFVSEIGLQMERRTAAARPQASWLKQAGKVGWYLIPVGVLAALLFIQTAMWVSIAVGLIPGAEQTLTVQVQSAPKLLPGAVSGALSAVDLLVMPGWGWITAMISTAVLGLVYLGWLASWWLHHQQRATE